jgi:RNA polymerase sigma factor (sigma-70 family)
VAPVVSPLSGLSPWTSERDLVSAAVRREEGAQEALVEAYMPRIAKAARVYRNNTAVARSELIQDGVVGLLRALDRFDQSLGTPFWAYASWWVRQAMQQLVAEMTRQVVLSDRALRRLSRIKDARAAWLRTERREPTVHELTEICGCSREHIERLLAAELPSRGLEEPVGGAEGGRETLGERVTDERSDDQYVAVVERTQLSGLREHCQQLSERERHVVYAHFGLDGEPRTLREIAEELSLSVERVRQIEDAALTRLRGALDPTPRPAPEAHDDGIHAIDPGPTPGALRHTLADELASEGCTGASVHDLVSATHELAVGAWLRGGGPPRAVCVGRDHGAIICEISDPNAGPVTRAAASIVARRTSRVDHVSSEGSETFRLWA